MKMPPACIFFFRTLYKPEKICYTHSVISFLPGCKNRKLRPEGGIRARSPVMKISTKLNLIFCGFAFALMMVYLFCLGETKDLLTALGRIQLPFLGLALLIMLVYWFLEALSTHIILKKICPEQKFRHTFITTVIGQYFNCITPFASGGQPMQAYYMGKYGVPASASISVLMSRLILYHVAETLYCLVVLILRFSLFTTGELGALMVLAIIGFIVCSAFIVFLLLISFCKNWTMKVVSKVIYLLARIRLIKDPQKTCESIEASMDASFNNMKFVLREPWMLTKVIITTALELTVYFSVSYVIYRGFGLGEHDFLTVISCQAFVYLISAFMPMPGAMGAAEGSYVGYFSYIYNDGSLVAISTFIWRFLTFYLPIVVGIILTLILQRNKKGTQVIDRQNEEPPS